jgi:beta-lactamase superfamily II metal-dependent hydrolase
MNYYDAIIIRFSDDDGAFHNIIIDGGDCKSRRLCYVNGLKERLKTIFERGESIDLWIISHIDDDHIGGLLHFVDDEEFFLSNADKLKSVWFNYVSNEDYFVHRSGEIGVKSGIRLRDAILNNKIQVLSDITVGHKCQVGDAEMKVIAPNLDSLNRLKLLWRNAEFKDFTNTSDGNISAKEDDYSMDLERFDTDKYDEDSDEKNNSSIAVVLSYHGKNFLFAADSCSSLLLEGLNSQGFMVNGKAYLELMHVPHHGSCRNSSKYLFDSIECNTFVVTGDGRNRYHLPHKETLARLLKSKSGGINIHFSTCTCALKSVFKHEEMWNINIYYNADFKYE